MKCKMDLVNPIMIDGKKYKELTYDFQEITIEDYLEMESYFKIADSDFAMTPTYCMAILFTAIIAVNRNMEYIDLMRLKGVDVINASILGRNFLFLGSEGSPVKTSDDAQDNTADTSAHH